MSGWRSDDSVGSRPPRFLAITDGRRHPGADYRGWVSALVDAGVDGLQLREKASDDRIVFELATEARSAAAGGLEILINSRADIAVAAELGGVHLPTTGLPLSLARSLLGPDALIGRSTHHPDEVTRAFDGGADYVTFGPVYPTPSKEAYGPPAGLEGLERAVERGGPVLALGGITMERARECADAGAYGIAGIRVFSRPETLTGLKNLSRRLCGDDIS